jgi:hypothetical protein
MPQKIKRLVLIIVISLIAILLAKSLLTRAVKYLNLETQKKQQAKLIQQSSILPASSPIDISSAAVVSENIPLVAASSADAVQNLTEKP